MFRLLKRTLIRDYENTASEKVRVRYGVCAGAIGLALNTLLCACKLGAGLLSGSLSLIADAVNNFSDAGASTATLVGFALSARPADRKHPYGHARYEYLAGLIVALLVLCAGVLLAKSSVEKILSPAPISVGVFSYVTLSVAMALKIFQSLLFYDFAKRIDSRTLKASGADSRNDVFVTGAVLLSALLFDLGGINADGAFGLGVSVVILLSALKLIKDCFDPLLGEAPDKDLIRKLEEALLSHPEILGIHDLRIHSYGVNHCFATVDAEIDAARNFSEAHNLMDAVEEEIRSRLPYKKSQHTAQSQKSSDIHFAIQFIRYSFHYSINAVTHHR